MNRRRGPQLPGAQQLRAFLDLPSMERRLLISAAVLVATVRVGLSLLPFQTLRRILTELAQGPTVGPRANRPSVDRVAWAVTVASRYVPKASCLIQALAAQVLLARHGHPARLRIGVAKGAEGRLEGHAWLEHQGVIVVGGRELPRYILLAGLE